MAQTPNAVSTRIEVIGAPIVQRPGQWQPCIGPEIQGLELPSQGRDTIIGEAINVLRRCVPPAMVSGQQTGLVVGYVQSGKTMSFTTVAALARDNGYRMIIIVAGTSRYLLSQSRERLINDLRLNSRSERRPWRHVHDPTLAANSHTTIQDVLEEWKDAEVPPLERRTVLVTVMKHHRHLQNLIEVLQRVSLAGVPTLIIDDEGDQAGLNTKVNQQEQSATYQRLISLKSVIPHHSFLQYTATPQAPLLINIVDLLSPAFAEVLSPGRGYTGGREFFTNTPNLVRVIPQDEIPTADNILDDPPQSLLQAMRLFLLGTAAHIVTNDPAPNRSMMVHPSQLTAKHGQYAAWVSRAVDGWKQILSLPGGTPEREELASELRRDYQDLAATTVLPPFEDLMRRLRHALLRTTVREVNSAGGRSAPVNWSETPYWILVGGQAMDRGFTVEGLTVTYMPRGPGVGNADTIQQRARFLGYKEGYRGYCRVFLEAAVRDAFVAYVDHEEDVRSQLLRHRETGRPMSEWRRQFFLTRDLRPTRSNVIEIDYRHDRFGDEWLYPEGLHDVPDAVEANRQIFEQLRAWAKLLPYDGYDRRKTGGHLMARLVPLRDVHEEFLTRIQVRRLQDSRLFSGLLRIVQVHLAVNPAETCSVFFMAGGEPIRRDYKDGRIKQLFQGRQYDKEGTTYHGDRSVKDDDCLSIQIRYLNLGAHGRPPIATSIPHLAVWIPNRIAKDMVQQPQGG